MLLGKTEVLKTEKAENAEAEALNPIR